MNPSLTPLLDVIQRLVLGICAHPRAARIDHTSTLEKLIVQISVHRADQGKIIGKGGKVINALVLIGKVAGERVGHRVKVILEDSTFGAKEPDKGYVFDPAYDAADAEELTYKLCGLIFDDFRVSRSDYGKETTFEVYLKSDIEITSPIIQAICDVLYCYGNAKGRKIEIEFATVNA